MKKVYFISGLGADERVFRYLDLSFCEPVFIHWLKPLPGETLAAYALRLRQTQVKDTDATVIGLSLGGMLAAEMARQDAHIKAILLSSNKHSGEFPVYLRLFRYMPVYRWLPGSLLKKMQGLYTYAFGVKDPQQKKLLYQVIADADIPFVKWAIHAILHWRTNENSGKIVQIHGSADRLLRLKYVKPDFVIDGGSHTMTIDKHQEISRLLKQLTA